MRSARFLILYLIVPAGIVLLTLEYFIRILHLAPVLPPHYAEFIDSERLPFRVSPNLQYHINPWPKGNEFEFDCVTNSQGFRDVEHNFEKPKGTFRILALGDSFTFGGGAPFEKTYPYQLEKLLNEPENKLVPVEVINAGQPRYWPEPERLLLEIVGIKYKPDLILAEFTLNDISDTHFGMNFNRVRKGYLISREGYGLGNVGVWLYIRSHLCRKVIRLYLDQERKHLFNNQSNKMKWEEVFKPKGYHEKDWLLVESEYRRMIKIANKIGAQIMFVYVPSGPYENEYALKRFMEWGRRNNVLVIDTLSALNKASNNEKVYWSQDIHCTPAGYRVIAETVCLNLINKQLIPKRKGE